MIVAYISISHFTCMFWSDHPVSMKTEDYLFLFRSNINQYMEKLHAIFFFTLFSLYAMKIFFGVKLAQILHCNLQKHSRHTTMKKYKIQNPSPKNYHAHAQLNPHKNGPFGAPM